ncbi:retropepsin-like aspartic protease [Snuella sedimenti]|uniref:Clan AA aspartic protease n=1 Tax=Snuella sedimenti TaxID=2798802 RepID=A0A8J7IYW8_9FLAO|nr:retropepsin-like aspartic protease [Snuella sedimenti]MBJ6369200.1 clan AA aspartic protease [Snuella sedimenti]
MTKQILNIIFCFVLTITTYSQKTTFKTGRPTTKNYYTQINYKNINGKLIIPVVINKKTYRFLFDTGAPNLISSTLASTIGKSNNPTISVSDANLKKQHMELTTIPLLTIGEVTFKNTSALVFDRTNNLVFDCYAIDGIIGSNLLRKSVIQILPKKHLIILTNNRNKLELNKSKSIDLMLEGNQSSPYINIKIKGHKNANEKVLIDTGASGFYDMCKTNYAVLEQHNVVQPFATGRGASSIGLLGTSEEQIQYQIKIPTIEIAGHDFKNVSTITSSDSNSRIGSEILKYGAITINFKDKQFYFGAYDSENDLTEKHFGFTPTIKNNKLIVGIVWDDTLKSKISSGDEILKVNDLNFSELNICDLITKGSPFKNSNSLEITTRNQTGKVTSLNLEKHK